MEMIQHLKAMSAFCRQRSKMEGEDEQFWLTEAELLAKLVVNAERLKRKRVADAVQALKFHGMSWSI